ncbi:MAG: uroporphyrinogen-III synthase [Planctomycetota bacterium]
MSGHTVDSTDVRSLLVTGPIHEREAWKQAALDAGWAAIDRPLLQLESTSTDLALELDGLPDWLCITSSNALPSVEAAIDQIPELRSVPLAVVGERTAKRAQRIGLRPGLPPAASSRDLSDALLIELGDVAASTRVLWPRGSRAGDFGDSLRDAKVLVQDPIVYSTSFIQHESQAPVADAIFFASPSAVHAWSQADHERVAPCMVIAIGATTEVALREFFPSIANQIRTLDSPTPACLTKLLAQTAPPL